MNAAASSGDGRGAVSASQFASQHAAARWFPMAQARATSCVDVVRAIGGCMSLVIVVIVGIVGIVGIATTTTTTASVITVTGMTIAVVFAVTVAHAAPQPRLPRR